MQKDRVLTRAEKARFIYKALTRQAEYNGAAGWFARSMLAELENAPSPNRAVFFRVIDFVMDEKPQAPL